MARRRQYSAQTRADIHRTAHLQRGQLAHDRKRMSRVQRGPSSGARVGFAIGAATIAAGAGIGAVRAAKNHRAYKVHKVAHGNPGHGGGQHRDAHGRFA